LTAIVLGCSSPAPESPRKAPAPVILNGDIERPEFADPAWATSLLAELRTQLQAPPALLPEAIGDKTGDETAFVCSYSGAPVRSTCAMGEGATMSTAARQAVEALRLRLGAIPQEQRLSLDIVIHRRPDRLLPITPQLRREDGLKGYMVELEGQQSFVLPSRVLTAGLSTGWNYLHGVPAQGLIEELIANNSDIRGLTVGTGLTAIRTAKWVESPTPGEQAHRLYRVHPYQMAALEPDLLLERIVWAADHLTYTVDAAGRVRYLYDPRVGEEEPGYNLLRHAGTTYSLIQAYQRLGEPQYLAAADRAIQYLMENTRRDRRQGPYGGGEALYVLEGDTIKLGGAGLALLMLVEHMDATGSREHLADAQAFARFLVAMQRTDGEFIYHAPIDPKGEPEAKDSAYYPGEAILGLMRLYALDSDPLWLDTAKRGADWLIRVRDAGKTPENLANDHWLMIGLSYLVRETSSSLYIEHSLALARAVAVEQERTTAHSDAYIDYRGGYYDPPRSTPAATRGEGLVAVLDTCKLADLQCDWVLTVLKRTETHAILSQYTPATVWWMAHPERVVGGFAGGIVDLELRSDFTQHNLSAMLGTERHLSDRVLPGGPSWRGAERPGRDYLPDAQSLDAIRGSLLTTRAK
jgi:hypothetical protein